MDRDGVVIEQVHHLHKIEDVKLIKNVDKTISLLKNQGLEVILITNQSAVARGLCDEEKLKDIHNHIEGLLNIKFDAIYYCPHHPTKGIGKYKLDCDCRKPNPGMLLKAAKERNIDLKESYVVGDKLSDIQAGLNAGCKTLGVKTGYGCVNANPHYLVDDVYAAAKKIVELENDN